MPTITHKPQWGSPSGYTAELSFTDEQIAELVDLLGLDPSVIARPLREVAAWYGRVIYINTTEASTSEQRAALEEVKKDLGTALSKIRALDLKSRRRVLDEYAGGSFDESLGDLEDEAIVARSGEALAEFNADLAAIARAYEKFGAARKRVKPRKGRPENRSGIALREKLSDAYDRLTLASAETPRRQTRRRRQFLSSAMSMLIENSQKTTRRSRVKVPNK